MNTEALIARVSASIDAPKENVWEALVTPKIIKRYMFGTDVVSDFQEGSQIRWKGEWEGKSYEDKGEIRQFRPNRLLQFTHFSPSTGDKDVPENYHIVTIELSGEKDKTTVVLTQDNNQTEKSREHSEKNWGMMLDSLKKVLEGKDTSAPR